MVNGAGLEPAATGLKVRKLSIISYWYSFFLQSIFLTAYRSSYTAGARARNMQLSQRFGHNIVTALILQSVETKMRFIDLKTEDTFKSMKNVDYLRWRPSFHWTTQKLKVHGLYCVLALLLASLAREKTAQAKMDLSMHALLDELNAIREVAAIYPQGTLAHGKDHITLSHMSLR